jgi:hypothetical protein
MTSALLKKHSPGLTQSTYFYCLLKYASDEGLLFHSGSQVSHKQCHLECVGYFMEFKVNTLSCELCRKGLTTVLGCGVGDFHSSFLFNSLS